MDYFNLGSSNFLEQLMAMQDLNYMLQQQQRQRQMQSMRQSSPSSSQSSSGNSPVQLPSGTTTILKNAFNSGSNGYGGVGNIAAIIALQHELSNATGKNRQFEGVQTDDIFSSNLGGAHFATEPWAAWSFDKLGLNAPTSGEKFDAAMENKDYGMALRRLPAAASHYLDIASALPYDALQSDKFGTFGKVISKAAFPWRWAMDLFD